MKKPLKIVVLISFAVYVMMIISVTFLSGRHALHDVSITDHFINRSNLIPFRTVSSYIRAIKNNSINFDIPIKNIVGNIFLFLPMSAYIACMFKKCRSLPINLLVIFTVLITVEALQIVTRLGSFDIDDLILNMLGALIGFALWKLPFVRKRLVF